MKRFLTALLAAAVAGTLFVAAPLGAAPKGTENYNKSFDTAATDCDEGHELVIHAPTKLWPPNHKYFEDVYVIASSDDSSEAIELTTSGVHDQYGEDGTEMNGAGNTTRDIYVDDEDADKVQTNEDQADPQVVAFEEGAGSVRTDWAVRAERSGQDQTGRVYTLSAMALIGDDECSVSVDMTVPHDMRPSNR